jgi:hypothetical protein
MWAISAGIIERKKMFIDVVRRFVYVEIVHFNPGVPKKDCTVTQIPRLFSGETFSDRSSLSQCIDDDAFKNVRTDSGVDEKHCLVRLYKSRDLGRKISRNFKDDALFMGYLAI